MARRLREAVEAFAGKPAEAAAYAGDVDGWLNLTGYAGDAGATARGLRCRAVDTLTDGGETLAAAQILAAVKPPDLPRLVSSPSSAMHIPGLYSGKKRIDRCHGVERIVFRISETGH